MGWTFYDSSGRRLSTVVQDVSNGGNAGALVLGTNDSNSLTLETNNTARMVLAAGGDVTVSTGNVVIGTAGKGIDFSAQTQSTSTTVAEVLDHYETGTFTPALKNGVSGNTMSHATQFGHYTRIGNRVYINLRVIVNGNGDATDAAMAIFGLPFTCDSTANSETGMICGYSAGLNLGAAGYSLNGITDANSTAKFWLKQWSATTGNGANVTRDELSTDATLNFSGMYEVDS
jgi:hypothetical protein